MDKKAGANSVFSRHNVKYVKIFKQRKERSRGPRHLKRVFYRDPLVSEEEENIKEEACPFVMSLGMEKSNKAKCATAPHEVEGIITKDCGEEVEGERIIKEKENETSIHAVRTVLAANNDFNNGMKTRPIRTIPDCPGALCLPFLHFPQRIMPLREKPCNSSELACKFNREQPAVCGRKLVANFERRGRMRKLCTEDCVCAEESNFIKKLTVVPTPSQPTKENCYGHYIKKPTFTKPAAADISSKPAQDRAYSSLPRARTMYPPAIFAKMPPIRAVIKRPSAGSYPTCVNPTNLEKQQTLFFQSGCTYNPVFEYEDEDAADRALETYRVPKAELLPVAISIMQKLLYDYGSESRYLEETGGPVLSLEETQDTFGAYIRSLGLESCVTITFASNTVSPTTILHNGNGKSTVVIGLPIEYRKNRIQGVLDHEIGTHFLRKFNDGLQIWAGGYRRKYELKAYMTTEEGFAALNQLVHTALEPEGKPYLFKAALNYYSAYKASQMSFAELYKDIEKYIDCPKRRFNACLRVKRGLVNTGRPGGMYKDQVYLEGAVKLLRRRKEVNFRALYAGKISVDDMERLQRRLRTMALKLPWFLGDSEEYARALDRIAEFNGISAVVDLDHNTSSSNIQLHQPSFSLIVVGISKVRGFRPYPRGNNIILLFAEQRANIRMEVTSKTFQERLPSIIEAINTCDFFAIDTEFSGIALNMRDRGHVYDTMEDRYQKIKFVCQNYLSWQFGLSVFKYNPADNNYVCRTYTFPVFPRENAVSRRSYIMSSSALKFLAEHHFPFTKVIEEGIGYQQLAKEAKVMEQVEKFIVKNEIPPTLKVAPGKESKEELARVQEKIEAWMGADAEANLEVKFSSVFVRDYFLKSEVNRRLGNEGIERRKTDALATLFTKTKKSKRLAKQRQKSDTPETKQQHADFKAKEVTVDQEMKMKELREEMGLAKVVDAMIHSKKPLIGHNFIYDIGFIYHQYIDDLPETYEVFKKRFHECFPSVYDTKVIAYNHGSVFSQFKLEFLLKRCVELNKGVVRLVFPPEFRNLEEVKEEHSAGFDAFCCGKAFVILAKLIEHRTIKSSVNPSHRLEPLAAEEEKTTATNGSSGEKKELKKEEEKPASPESAKAKLVAMLANFHHGPAGSKK